MDLIIKGMAMPKNCFHCPIRKPLCGGVTCPITKKHNHDPAKRPDSCPLSVYYKEPDK